MLEHLATQELVLSHMLLSFQDTPKVGLHSLGMQAASRLEHPETQQLVLLHTPHPLQDMPKVGLCLLGTQAALVGAPVAHADMCSSGCWLPAATCATPAVKLPCPWCVVGLWSSGRCMLACFCHCTRLTLLQVGCAIHSRFLML